MSKGNRGIGPVPEGLSQPLADFLGQMRRHVTDVLAGRVSGLGGGGGGSGSGSGSIVIGGGSGGEYEPDLTPPPTPTGVNVVAGIAVVLFRTDDPVFTQGHGHLATLVYGKKYSGTGPLPTYSSDAKQFEFSGLAGALATDPATQWHFWVTWKSKDGVESVAPAGGLNGFQVTTGQDVALLLDALTGQITESELYGALGSRIDLIDGAAGLAGSVNARIASEATTRSTADDVIATAVTTVSARMDPGGDTYAAIQTEATTRATQTGELFAQYTVKLDVGGKVSGFGLASTGPTGPGSSFIIRADKFAVAPPAGVSGVSDRIPFVVQATDTTEGGVAIPKGVYMDAAYIINLTATYARFQSLVADDIATASLFAVDATIGSIKGTYEIRSTTYTSGPGGSGYRLTPTLIELPATSIRGKITATQFDGRGAVIRDDDGNPIFSVNDPLAAARITPAPGWLNSNLVPSINAAKGTNLFAGTLSSISGYLDGSLFAVDRPDPHGTNNAVDVDISAEGGYVYWRTTGLQPGYYTVKLRLKVVAGISIVVSTTDTTSWDGGTWTRAETASATPVWVQVVLRQLVSSAGALDVAVGSFRGTSPAYSTPAATGASVSDLWLEREDAGIQQSISAAAAAQGTATTAATNATSALSTLATMRSNGYLDAAEKPELMRRWQAIADEDEGIAAQGTAYGLTSLRDAYNSATAALGVYLAGLSPPWNDTTTDTPITPAVDQAAWAAYYSARQTLLNAISDEAAKRAQWALVGGSGKPEDNATVGATIGSNLAGAFTQTSWDVVMTSAFIRAAHIQQLTAANLTVQAISDTVNGGASSGGRVVITSNRMDVYDATNALRGRFGLL